MHTIVKCLESAFLYILLVNAFFAYEKTIAYLFIRPLLICKHNSITNKNYKNKTQSLSSLCGF